MLPHEGDSSDDEFGAVPQTTKQYADATSIHGIFYLFEHGRFMFERILWMVLLLTGTYLSIIMAISLYTEWRAKPVLTTVSTTGLPVEKIEFPSITICSQGSVNEIIGIRSFTAHANWENILKS